MHILFISDNFPPEINACASRVFERAKYWVQWGHQVTVITCAPNFPEGELYPGYKNRWYQVENMAGIRVIRVKTLLWPNHGTVMRILDFLSFWGSATVAGIFQRQPVDVVVATSPQLFSALAGWQIACFKRRPFVFELSDLWPASIMAVSQMEPGRLLRGVEKLELFLYRRAQVILAQTQAFKDDLVRRGIDPHRIEVIYNGVELQYYQPQPKDEGLLERLGLQEKTVFAYIGTLGMAHDLSSVLKAMKIVEQKRQDIALLLAGPGSDREALMTESTRLGLQQVRFIDKQPKSEMPRYWSIADVALVHLKAVPTFSTVVPSKLLEAMAMGKPILLAAPPGEASQIVERYQAGSTLLSGDSICLAEKMCALADDPHQRLCYAGKAKAAAQFFSREHQARQMMDALQSTQK